MHSKGWQNKMTRETQTNKLRTTWLNPQLASHAIWLSCFWFCVFHLSPFQEIVNFATCMCSYPACSQAGPSHPITLPVRGLRYMQSYSYIWQPSKLVRYLLLNEAKPRSRQIERLGRQIEGQTHGGGNRLKTRSRGEKPSIFKSYLWLGYFLWMRWLMWICEDRHALSIDNFSSIGASDDLSTSLFIEFLTQLFHYWSIYWSGSSIFFYYIG